MAMPTNIDLQAVQMLAESNWLWSDAERAFIETRDPLKKSPEEYRSRFKARVTHEDLRDHGLVGPASGREREAGFGWLRERLSV